MLLLLLCLALGSDEAAATQALELFKGAPKAKDPGARAAAVTELAKASHAKVAAKLGAILAGDVPEARIAAAKGLVGQLEDKKKTVQLLVQGALANAKEPVILTAIVAALGSFGEDAGAPEVNKHLSAENLDLVKAAIEAAGQLKSATSMDPLIKALKDADETLKPREPNKPGEGRGLLSRLDRAGGANPREERERARELQPLLKKTLSSIIGVQCQDGKDFEDWWKEHKLTFKPQK